MGVAHVRLAHCVCAVLVGVALLFAALFAHPAGASTSVECQHPVRTGVEVYKLHHITSHSACPVALALYSWETNGNRESALYGCHGIGHPYLRLHSFHGWHLSLTPDFVMSRHGASFAVGGTDFPINCT
jgi:hypothetical protein